MTLRLVGLMSVVLLLSLAAFGLLMSNSQEQVMQEVAHTASALSKDLLSLEFQDRAEVGRRAFFPSGSAQGVWRSVGPVIGGPDGTARVRQFRLHANPPGDAVEQDEELQGVVGLMREGRIDRTVVVREHVRGCSGEPAESCEELQQHLEEHGPGQFVAGLEGDARNVFIMVEGIRVDSHPGQGMSVKIPTFTEAADAAAAADPGYTVDFTFETVDPDGAADPSGSSNPSQDVLLARHDEIRLPIPVEEYDRLFDTIRGRSLMMFLGVFVLGTVLTAGVATRFTRPIRRLDRAFHRLSAGDLDVRVGGGGKDEIGRLSDSFNAMAQTLRANRDRAREMVRREKLSALGSLAAGVAHDVRNPLHSIGLTLQHLSETSRPESSERAQEFDRAIDIIRAEIRRLDQLVANFLRFSRAERGERQPVDLADMLRETARLVHKEAEWRGVEVELDINEAVPAVSAAAESIRSSILNLVLNSFDAMPKGGRLMLRLRVEGCHAVVEVEDTGHGIPEEDQERVFEFAYTTREGGNGLGLATVHHCLVEEHGGRVRLDSEPGRGTRVELALPIRAPERESSG